jgi:hypothetical protein
MGPKLSAEKESNISITTEYDECEYIVMRKIHRRFQCIWQK